MAAIEFINLFDKDKNGEIDAKEFAAFHRSLTKGQGGDSAQAQVKDIADRYKTDKKR